MTTLAELLTTVPGGTADAVAIERGLLGALLLDGRGASAWPTLAPEHFYMSRHRMIFEAILGLLDVTERPDLPLLVHELRRQGKLEEVGGVTTLASMVEEGIACVDLRAWGARIRQGHTDRLRIQLAAELLQDPSGSERVDEVLRALEDQPSYSEDLAAVFQRIEQGPAAEAIDVGLGGLDLRRGQITVLGGRTSHGKTAFACEIAVRVAEGGTPVDIVTLEDPAEAIGARILANRAARSVFYVRASRLAGLDTVRGQLEALPIRIVSVPGNRESAVLGAVASSRAELIVLDHLQHVETPDDELKRHQALDRIMGRLVSIARRDEQRAILCTAQLNREMEKVKRPPMLSDLRDSGAIEQKARQVWLIYWPAKHDPKRKPEDVSLAVAKNTEGPTRRLALKWDAKSGHYWNAPEASAEG